MNSHSEEISRLAEAMEKENSKREVLRTLDCFMLDSSLRESAVGQPCNHTLEEKMAILEEVKKKWIRACNSRIVCRYDHDRR